MLKLSYFPPPKLFRFPVDLAGGCSSWGKAQYQAPETLSFFHFLCERLRPTGNWVKEILEWGTVSYDGITG
jgi:hypothetical protein